MKQETYNRPLSDSTVGVLADLLADLLHQDRDESQERAYKHLGMVLASPKVGVLAQAGFAREVLQQELVFLKLTADNTHLPSRFRTESISKYKAIHADIEFGANKGGA